MEQLVRRSTVVWGTSGSARAPMHRGVCYGLRLPCGAALAHLPLLDSNRMGAHTAMCVGRVLVLFSILLRLSLFTSATEGVDMFMRLGGCVSFSAPKSKFTRHRCCEGQRWETRWRVLPGTTQTSSQVFRSELVATQQTKLLVVHHHFQT